MLNNYNQQNLHNSNYLKTSNKQLPPLLKGLGSQKIVTESPSDSDAQSNIGFLKKPKKGYELADYSSAVQYFHSQSYTKKIINHEGQPEYQQYEVCVDTTELKKYGLGIYLYLEFIKRLAVTFLIMTSIYIVPIVYAYINGTGLKSYKQSYMIILAKTSLGNIYDGDQLSYILFTIGDILSMIVLFAFYFHWRSFHNQAVSQQTRSPDILNPVMYSLSVVGFDPKTPNLQKNLQEYINRIISDGTSVQVAVSQNYQNAHMNNLKLRYNTYEVSAIQNYNGQFSKFVLYDELVQKKQKQRQIMIQTGKNNEDFLEIQKQIAELEGKLQKIAEQFQPYEAIIHFQTIRGKHKFIRFCKIYSLFDKISSGLKRFFCCQHLPPQSKLFMGKDALLIKNQNLSRPQQIIWPNLDISGISRIIRWIFSIIFLLISILITSSAIALCTLYVSSSSACTNFDQTTLLTQAQAQGGQTLYCYCSLHFTEIYSDVAISTACNGLSNTILYANIMQVGASLVSSVSNILLIIAVGLIGRYILKPDSRPKQFSFIFVGVLISNYINASILPLVMNGDIYGFQSLSYLKFINFIDFSKVAIFKDYNRDWYAVMAPYYMNFLIIAIISPLINLFVSCISGCLLSWKVKSACQNTDKKNPVIQKQANKMITSNQFDLATQQAIVCLNIIICIMYSSMIPILLPITTIYLIITFLCKKAIILRYSIRIPADEALSSKIIHFLPFVLLLHFLMGIWSHTADGVFNQTSFLVKFEAHFMDGQFNRRAFLDILMLGGAVVIAAWIIFDYTIVNFFSFIGQCCQKDSDEIILPNDLATKQNRSFKQALKSANIQGSYKLVNNPIYGHAIKAYRQLKKRKEKQTMRKTMRSKQSTQDNLSPQKFGRNTMDTLDFKNNNEINYINVDQVQEISSSAQIINSNQQQGIQNVHQGNQQYRYGNQQNGQNNVYLNQNSYQNQNNNQQNGQYINSNGQHAGYQNNVYQNMGVVNQVVYQDRVNQ